MSENQPDVAAFLAALEGLPAYPGICFRGRTPDAEFVRPGQVTVIQGLMATSRDLDVATAGGTLPEVYAVRSRTGRDITPFSADRDEQEVVFLPGTAFALARSRRAGRVTVHLVVEFDPAAEPVDDTELAETEQLVNDLVARHRFSPREARERFRGDIA